MGRPGGSPIFLCLWELFISFYTGLLSPIVEVPEEVG